MRPANALRLYWVRLRARLAAELLAVAGIAAGVALLFAAQVSTTSLDDSVRELARGIEGEASLSLSARDPHGLPRGLLGEVRRIRGVRVAAPLLEASAQVSGPRGSVAVQLIGADSAISRLGGSLARNGSLTPFGQIGAVALPASVSTDIGIGGFGQEMRVQVYGRAAQAPLYQVLGTRKFGVLAASPLVIAPLFYAQQLTGLPGRVTRILVVSAPGMRASVTAALRTLAAGRANVVSTGHEQRVFEKAAAANNRASTLFSVISALVGFLFAFNAALLTVRARRQLAGDMQRDGYTARTVLGVLALDALMLGALASALGLAIGDQLSIHLLHPNTAFLSLAFAIGSEREVSVQTVAVALGGGLLAATVAVLSPLRDVLARDPLAAIRQPATSRRFDGGWRALLGIGLATAMAIALQQNPNLAVPAMVALICALLLVLPAALSFSTAAVSWIGGLIPGVAAHVTVMELRVARSRARAIAATGALAAFGSVAIQGAHHDLLAGLDRSSAQTSAIADVWVSPAGTYDLFDTAPLKAHAQRELERLSGVRSVGVYRGGLLDYGNRRALVLAPEAAAATRLLESQGMQMHGPLGAGGGWVAMSPGLAREHGLRIGQSVVLPTPRPMRLRLAGLLSNLGWAPGAIVMSAGDYARAWASRDISAYTIELRAGVSPTTVTGEVTRTLGRSSGLQALSSTQREAEQRTLSRQALARLDQIAHLILVAAVLAMAAAIGALLWQRRPLLAKLRLEGIGRAQLWRTVLLESMALAGLGTLTGAIFGVICQRLADQALVSAVDFPVISTLHTAAVLGSVAAVIAAVIGILAVPGYLAASVPAALALEDR